MATIQEVRQANQRWFDNGNKKFFQDRSYDVLHSQSGKPYLLRSTYGWSDMFGRPKVLRYKVNPIDPETLIIKTFESGAMGDDLFDDREEAKKFIKRYAE